MLLQISAILAGLCVFLGAFAAHIIENSLPSNLLSTFKTANYYMQWHTLAIILTVLCQKSSLIKTSKPAICFLTGILLFSGSLLLYVFTQIKWLVYITPIGGLLFMIGWVYFALSVINKSKKSKKG